APALRGRLDRKGIGGLLDDADHALVAAGVRADRAHFVLRPVAALAAEADALLHHLDRLRELERLLLLRAQEGEREALRGARADAGQARQLRDEILDGRREHVRIVPVSIGRSRGRYARADPTQEEQMAVISMMRMNGDPDELVAKIDEH